LRELEDDFLEYYELFEAEGPDTAHVKARALVAEKYNLSLITTQKLLDNLGYYQPK
jgi:hypothetical protein